MKVQIRAHLIILIDNTFKNEYFFPILDQGIVSINERFQQLRKFND